MCLRPSSTHGPLTLGALSTVTKLKTAFLERFCVKAAEHLRQTLHVNHTSHPDVSLTLLTTYSFLFQGCQRQ